MSKSGKALRAHIEAVSKPGARIRVTTDLTRYDPRLTPGQIGTVLGPPRTRIGREWAVTGATLVYVRFDCGAELDIICKRDVKLVSGGAAHRESAARPPQARRAARVRDRAGVRGAREHSEAPADVRGDDGGRAAS